MDIVEVANGIAKIAVDYPAWVIALLVSIAVSAVAIREINRQLQHQRELESQRLKLDAGLQRDWLKSACRAAEKEDTEAFLRIAGALRDIRQTGEGPALSGDGPADGSQGGPKGTAPGPDARLDSVDRDSTVGHTLPPAAERGRQGRPE